MAKSTLSPACKINASNSCFIGMTLSIAFDGVEALMSAIMSLTKKSDSWPTALTTGTGQSIIALQTDSRLNDQRSSGEPPPLPKIIKSAAFPAAFSARTICPGA